MTWTEFEAWINSLINGIPADILVDFDASDRDKLKGEIVKEIIQKGGNISDSDIRGHAKAIRYEKTGIL
jgi:hypothetical protein